MKNHVYVQAREDSKRFPKKILKKICGKSIVDIILERIQKIENVDEVFLITGSEKLNKTLIEEFRRKKIDYFSGSDENVLDRFFQASKDFGSENIIRITGDNPLLDFSLIDKGIEKFLDSDYDILSNNRKKTYPIGLNFEVFTQDALKKSWDIISETFDNKETFNSTFIPPTKIMLDDKRFHNFDLLNSEDLSDIRLTLDYNEDFLVISKIFELLYFEKKFFTLEDILHILKKNPNILEINKKFC